MKHLVWTLGCATLLLAGCDPVNEGQKDPSSQFIQELPENILAIADPSQDLTAVKVNPADGCLVYRYVGPVETTMLPLRTREGRPICTTATEPA